MIGYIDGVGSALIAIGPVLAGVYFAQYVFCHGIVTSSPY
jgi:hypothetical protein